MYAVCVTFKIGSDDFDRFLVRMSQQARDSLTLEPGCHRFDVCHNGQDTVFLYELYSDPDAFQIHVESNHFKDFDQEVQPWIVEKLVSTFENVLVGDEA